MNRDSCYCDSGNAFSDCCEPLLRGNAKATTPVSLMRSRYSAFCCANVEYLIASLHSSQRELSDQTDLTRTIQETDWVSLRVLSDSVQASRRGGVVEFVAFYIKKGSPIQTVPDQMHERSNFVQENETWFYLDGEMLPPLKLGRNDPCWCGSLKKLKQCHR